MQQFSGSAGKASQDSSSLGDKLGAAAQIGEAFTGSLGVATKVSSGFASGITQVTRALTGVFSQLANAVAPFVQALNPTLMFGLNYAMRGLQATIGVALTPVVEMLIGAVRQAAGILLPAAQKLAPIMRTLASTVSDFLIAPFLFLADIVDGLSPVFQFLADMGKALVDGWFALTQVTRTVVQSLLGWVKGLFGDANPQDFLKKFRDAVHSVVGALLKFTAYLAKAFNQLDFITNLAKNLRELGQVKPGATPAPTDVSTKGFEDIAKTMALAAFAAQAGGNPDDNEEKKWRNDIAKEIEGIKNNGETLQSFLTKMVEKFEDWLKDRLRDLPGDIASAVTG